jgi:L-malate glycosyltransferase
MQIHQMLPSLSYGDAIGNEVLELQRILRSWGYESDIYAAHIHPKLLGLARDYKSYTKVSSPDNILIFHFAIGSDVSKFSENLPDKKIIIYHNITPGHFFRGFSEDLFHLVSTGREELAKLSDKVELALGVSEFNRKELVDLGFKNTGVLPILIDFKKYDQQPDENILNRYYDDKYINLIFIGRISPNKKQEDLIKIFYYFNKFVEPRSRLFLVGSYKGMEKYHNYLNRLIAKLDLKNVYITGHVNFNELMAYYRLANVFISMSEHEGFCVPLVESMYFGIPIIAYNSTAIPDTLNGSGILVNKKIYEEISEMIGLLVNDEKFRDNIIKKQKSQLPRFSNSIVEAMLREYLDKVIE